ncbi:MoaD/ThiS family protein [Natranaerobius thermophilus]|uniref:ThiamineS protein n=1 Tax=Natranaerobius thermophilus (strain ATCC BAA-1301 / DSM 18059 / JW/NM-WN-LF) TaxID=457570 RepID=B2A7W3_NATTJ|nr:MoaD/ThiS family protein [Natranaerobius thermophilus]ACB84411.1 thiamineS protein [Natranaerobius thermophilus JW/NM-WN-LF]
MANIEVRCYATLREYLPQGAEAGVYQYETAKHTIGEIVDELGLPREDLHLIIKNGINVDLEETVEDGDRIGFFPPIGGG